ncbi:MAG: tdcB [Alphaproteobacteria bacterium]|jgi:threonine dehydratase|nr:tdcB [Alphaproteobacteria bacterium]
MTSEISLGDIQQAAVALENVTLRTPTVPCPWLAEQTGIDVFLKLENLQLVSSFKARGAYIKLSRLSEDQRRQGVIAMSAGNHAQGVAWHAQSLGIAATIVMPKNTPFAKIESVEKLGCALILEGQNLSEAGEVAIHLAKRDGLTLIHPYDDPAIITGQGTVALEMLSDVPKLDVLIIPVGGGGLAAGMAIAAKGINPKIEIIGVQSAYCPAMAETLYPGRAFPVQSSSRGAPLAEGIAVKSPGILTRDILKKHLSDMLIVTEDQIEAAIEDLLIHGKLTVEGAGATGVAAFRSVAHQFIGRKVGIVICGGNIDARILSSLLLRGLVRHGKLVRLKIEMNDAPGVLGQISQVIGQTGGNIFEVSHQRLFNHITVKMAEVDAIVETHDLSHAHQIVAALEAHGFPTQMLH